VRAAHVRAIGGHVRVGVARAARIRVRHVVFVLLLDVAGRHVVRRYVANVRLWHCDGVGLE